MDLVVECLPSIAKGLTFNSQFWDEWMKGCRCLFVWGYIPVKGESIQSRNPFRFHLYSPLLSIRRQCTRRAWMIMISSPPLSGTSWGLIKSWGFGVRCSPTSSRRFSHAIESKYGYRKLNETETLTCSVNVNSDPLYHFRHVRERKEPKNNLFNYHLDKSIWR